MAMTLIFLALYFIAATSVTSAPDNRGTEFIVAFMENFKQGPTSYDLDLFITTFVDSSVDVQVTIPKNQPSFDESFTLTSGNVQKAVIPETLRASGTAKEDKGILITASDEIVVIGVNREKWSNDGFLGLPTDVLGTEYYAVTYSPPSKNCQFLIAGVEDGTVVSVSVGPNVGNRKISYDGSQYGVGETFVVNLDRFDTFQSQLNKDLSGSFISSNKPVAFFSGNVKTDIGSGSGDDHLVEQLPPVKSWGKEFATVSIPDQVVGDQFLFLASENNTNVTVTGNSVSETFILQNKGDSRKISIGSGPDYYTKVVADKPILAIHFVVSPVNNNDDSDPAMILLSPLEQFESKSTFSTPQRPDSPYTHYFVFVVKDTDKDGLRIDGGAFPGDTVYSPIPGTDLVGGYISVSEGIHSVENSNPLARFFGYIYGKENLESYAMPTGVRLSPINQECVESPVSEADGLDNDCDGRIDEELCTGANRGVDEDGDGVVDEDCADGVPGPVSTTTAVPSPSPTASPGPVSTTTAVSSPSPTASPGPVSTTTAVSSPSPTASPGPVSTTTAVSSPSPTASPGPVSTTTAVSSPSPTASPGPVSTTTAVSSPSPTASPGPVSTTTAVPSPSTTASPGPVSTTTAVPSPSPTASPGPVSTTTAVSSPSPTASPGPVSTTTAVPSPSTTASPRPIPRPTAVPEPSPTPGQCTLQYALKRRIALEN